MDAFLQLGNFYVDIFSIIIVLVIVGAGVYGAFKGLFAGIIALSKGLIIVALGVLLAKPLASLLNSFGLGEVISNVINTGLQGFGEPFNLVIDDITDKAAAIQTGLSKIKIPDNIAQLLSNVLQVLIPDSGSETLGVYFADSLSNYAVISLAFFIIETLGLAIIGILNKTAKRVEQSKTLGPINRVLGAALYVVLAYLVIDAAMFALSFISVYVSSAGPWITHTMYLGEESSEIFTLSKFIYNNGLVRRIVELMIK